MPTDKGFIINLYITTATLKNSTANASIQFCDWLLREMQFSANQNACFDCEFQLIYLYFVHKNKNNRVQKQQKI